MMITGIVPFLMMIGLWIGTYINEVRFFRPSLPRMKPFLLGLDEIKPGINGSSLRVEPNLKRMVDTLKSLPRSVPFRSLDEQLFLTSSSSNSFLTFPPFL